MPSIVNPNISSRIRLSVVLALSQSSPNRSQTWYIKRTELFENQFKISRVASGNPIATMRAILLVTVLSLFMVRIRFDCFIFQVIYPLPYLSIHRRAVHFHLF